MVHEVEHGVDPRRSGGSMQEGSQLTKEWVEPHAPKGGGEKVARCVESVTAMGGAPSKRGECKRLRVSSIICPVGWGGSPQKRGKDVDPVSLIPQTVDPRSRGGRSNYELPPLLGGAPQKRGKETA